MKKALFILCSLFVLSKTSYAQNTFPSSGNVGIGTNGPAAVLTVTNAAPVIQLFDKDVNPHDGSSVGKLAFGAGGNEYASIEAIRVSTNFDDLSNILFRTSWATGAGGDGANIERMRINFNGNVGIGTTDTKGYKLGVNGSVIATSVTVKLYGNWADYVFKPKYKLPSLTDVKTYVDQNQHLPEIPSAAEVEKNGQNLGEMNRLLLKKVEELTLYAIENERKDKERDAAKDKLLASLQEQINALKQQQRRPSRAAKH